MDSHTAALLQDGRLILNLYSSYVLCVYVPGLRDPGTDTSLFQLCSSLASFLNPLFLGYEGIENLQCSWSYDSCGETWTRFSGIAEDLI
ncbi:hypothetical protein DPMN_126844 [Dreissena polymorpha]|uniref:Uncharacterized protein n=1 Tax=Dreissena polymorpha TaxID=45954 RepID=A0A9D4GY29_DREPO|nr:hypothetical protein DPMN_126844 [Dreissena polymorpha]